MVTVKVEVQGRGVIEVETDAFVLKEAVDIINGLKSDEIGNRLPGFMVGDTHYFRALEVVSIEVV